jgi:hypothetical protein
MKKAVLFLLSVGLIAGAAVACGGTDVEKEVSALGIIPFSFDFYDDDYTEGDFMTGNNEFEFTDEDSFSDWGSDITFDDINIILPCEGEDCHLDTTIPFYRTISGNVISIETRGMTYVTIEDTDGAITILLVGEDTLFPFSDNITVGGYVTGWYLTNAPAPAIYPPQLKAAVLAAEKPEGVNVRVNLFKTWENNDNGFFISHDGSFAFRTDENTKVILEDGIEFIGDEFDGRRIVVIYGVSTRSIPEIAVASRLIVLYENIMPARF